MFFLLCSFALEPSSAFFARIWACNITVSISFIGPKSAVCPLFPLLLLPSTPSFLISFPFPLSLLQSRCCGWTGFECPWDGL